MADAGNGATAGATAAGAGPAAGGTRPVASAGGGAGGPAAPARLRLLAGASVLALLVQLLLGVATTLWVRIPHHHPWTGASPPGLLWAHVVLGVALLANGFVLVGRAARASSDSRVLGSAALGLVGVLLALGAGASFVSGGQGNGASMAMAGGFALATAGVVGVLWFVPAPARG